MRELDQDKWKNEAVLCRVCRPSYQRCGRRAQSYTKRCQDGSNSSQISAPSRSCRHSWVVCYLDYDSRLHVLLWPFKEPSWLAAEEQLEFGVDLNAARYINGERETPNGEVRSQSAVLW